MVTRERVYTQETRAYATTEHTRQQHRRRCTHEYTECCIERCTRMSVNWQDDARTSTEAVTAVCRCTQGYNADRCVLRCCTAADVSCMKRVFACGTVWALVFIFCLVDFQYFVPVHHEKQPKLDHHTSAAFENKLALRLYTLVLPVRVRTEYNSSSSKCCSTRSVLCTTRSFQQTTPAAGSRAGRRFFTGTF